MNWQFWRWYYHRKRVVRALDPTPKPRPPRFRPHVDIGWQRNFPRNPPYGALDTRVVACWDCEHQHANWERINWNGSRSKCPRCGSEIVTFAKETFEEG